MANDVYALQIVGSVAGEPVENILMIQSSVANAANPLANAQAIIPNYQGAAEAQYLACLPDDYVLIGYKCRRVNNTGGPTAVLPTAGLNGTRGANSVSSGQGPVAIFNYTAGGHWRTGRFFFPGIADGDLVENVIQAALIAAVQAWITAAITTYAADGLGHSNFPVVWSRLTTTAHDIASTGMSGVIGTQRRRLHPAL